MWFDVTAPGRLKPDNEKKAGNGLGNEMSSFGRHPLRAVEMSKGETEEQRVSYTESKGQM